MRTWRFNTAFVLVLLIAGLSKSVAANLGTDNASAPAYVAGWSNGTDGGINGLGAFGQWFLNTNLPTAYTISSAAGIGNAASAVIDSAGGAFRILQTNGEASAFRFLDPAGLGVGQTFSIQMAVNFRNGFKGFDLRGAGAGDPTIFNFNIGGDDYIVNGAESGNGSVGSTYNANSVFTLSFTQTSGSGGTWSIARSGGVSSVTNGTYTGVARSIKLYNSSPGPEPENALFVNNLAITPVAGTSQQVLIDFGQTPTTNAASGKTWNNLTNTNNLTVGNLLDAGGAYTGYALAFSNTPFMNTNFGVIPNAGMGEFNEVTAVTDAVHTDTNRPSATLKISRLNRSNAYTFRIFGSRSHATETRVTAYTVAGSNTNSGSLTTSGPNVGGAGVNYNTNILTFSNVFPDRNGEVTVTFAQTQGAFGYLNAMSVGATDFPEAGSPYIDLANRWVDQDALGGAPSNPVVFIGSSSIRRWESLTRDFADYNVLQRGMGGAWFTDINQLATDLVVSRAPRAVVMWAGVNDIYNGQTGDHVFRKYTNFVATVTNAHPDTAIFYIGMTRNPGTAGTPAVNAARTNANAQISAFVTTNGNPNLHYIDLPAFFESMPVGPTDNPAPTDLWYYYVDSLHLNAAGYVVWGSQIRDALVNAGILPDRSTPGMVPFSGSPQKVLFDFGPSDGTNGDATIGPDERGHFWNNWHSINGGATIVPGERVAGLVDAAGNETGLAVTITGEFQANGKQHGGLTNIPSLALGNLGTTSASEDFFFSSADGLINGGDDDDGGGLRISGLNPALTYELRLFGSRSAADTRQTSYAVYGATTNTATLQTSGPGSGINGSTGNDRSVAVFSSVRPNAYGDLFVDLTALPVANNNNFFAYLNAMEITAVSPYQAWARASQDSGELNNALMGTNAAGVANIWSFAFDGSRSALGQGNKKFGHTFSQSGGLSSLAMTMPVRYGASFSGPASQYASIAGVEYEIQGSTNLVDWNVPVEATPPDTSGLPALSLNGVAGYEYRGFRLSPAAVSDKGFIRAVVRPAADSMEPLATARAGLQAAAFDDMSGVQSEPGGAAVGHFDGGDWVKYSNVDFGSGATSATFSASKAGTGGTIEIRLGSPTGRLIGTLAPQDTGGWGNYRDQLVQLAGFVSGVHDLYLVGAGATTGIANIASFRFSNYVLVWSDEFNGTSLNPNNWFAVDNGDVANGELQFYTPRTNNVTVEGGVLKLTAHREIYTGQGPWMSAPKTTQYTSGLVESLNKVEPQYGKIEASMKIPRGAGLWPAFWMMGVNYFTGAGWPLCGEIDIMEYSGASGGFTAAFHTGAYNYMNGGGGVQNVQGFSLSDYDTAFHVYGIEWTPTRVAFYVDGRVILAAEKSVLGSTAAQWPFDQPFWLKLNLAVGGPYGGDPTSGTFPKTMEVDWVRVYQEPE
jgi:beta-glucanase (GH16 family)/lysophospholipase L1-like esterase